MTSLQVTPPPTMSIPPGNVRSGRSSVPATSAPVARNPRNSFPPSSLPPQTRRPQMPQRPSVDRIRWGMAQRAQQGANFVPILQFNLPAAVVNQMLGRGNARNPPRQAGPEDDEQGH